MYTKKEIEKLFREKEIIAYESPKHLRDRTVLQLSWLSLLNMYIDRACLDKSSIGWDVPLWASYTDRELIDTFCEHFDIAKFKKQSIQHQTNELNSVFSFAAKRIEQLRKKLCKQTK